MAVAQSSSAIDFTQRTSRLAASADQNQEAVAIPAAGSGPVCCQLGVNSQMGGDGLFSSIEKAFQGYVLGQVYETVLQK